MNIILFDAKEWANLRPLTLTKPLAELRMGILTFGERWAKIWRDSTQSYLTKDYLAEKYSANFESTNLFLNPSFFPNHELIQAVKKLQLGQSLWLKGNLVAFLGTEEDFKLEKFPDENREELSSEIIHIQNLWDLFTYNDHAIRFDFECLTQGRKSAPISATNGVRGVENIFLEEGAIVEYAVLNATTGPIYIGKDSEIMEGSLIRGSLALCEGAKLNMGAKIYSGTTIGPYCKVGGEVNNSILMGYSNKGHDGFLGNSVLGEWCNLGADTNNSNLKNNYSEIHLWNYESNNFINTGLQFCGLMMGDFSKSAINTQFNTGTVVGVSANVFTADFPPKFIPSFSWGGGKNSAIFDLEKAYEAADRMMQRRKKELTNAEKNILSYLFKEQLEML